MDINEPGFHFNIDNDKHRDALKIVADTQTVEELGRAAIAFFDADVVSLESQQILAHFNDSEAHPLILEDERFDRDLFRAALLFALTTIEEPAIPEIVDHFHNYWANLLGVEPENYRAIFGYHHKEPGATPYTAMDKFVLSRITVCVLEQYVKTEYSQANEPADPLQEEIDGKPWKVVGMPELEEVDSLTVQFLHDLRKLFPDTVIQELDIRYTPDLDEAGIFALIETIEHERSHGIFPDPRTLVDPYKYNTSKLLSQFMPDREETRSDADFEVEAIERIEFLRSKAARQHTQATYVASLDEWVTWTVTDPEDGNPPYIEEAYVGAFNIRLRDLTAEEYNRIFQAKADD